MARGAVSNKRRIYLCTYDVSEDKRRSKLFDLLENHGDHVQFSVFLCSLTGVEMQQLTAAAARILHQGEDQLLVVDTGPDAGDWVEGLTCIGKRWLPPVRSQIV